MKTILTLFITAALSLAQTITTINPGDQVAAGPSVINTNFLNLNLGKMAFRAAYAGGTTYQNQDVVTSGGLTYVSIQSGNAGNTPSSSPSWWSAIGGGGTGGGTWGTIGGTLSSQTDLAAALAAKQATITTGTTGQYFRGDLSLAAFPTLVNTFNARSGTVIPTTGDYTAAQVTNAVDSTQTYANPTWLTSLAYSKITGVPSFLTANQSITITGDATGSGTTAITLNVGKLNGVALSGLGTGLLKNTTGTGVPSIATFADIFALFTGCSGAMYPGFDGVCHAASGSGTVTSVTLAVPSWLTGGGTSTTAPSFTIAPATAQTSHQVIGTCGTATTFTPCLLVAGDIPTTLPGITIDGVSPATMAFVDATSSIQGQLNAKGTGTVTVVGAGALTSTALVTGGGTTTAQTPAPTATMDSSGNITTPGGVTAASFTTSATTPGEAILKAGTGSLPALPANSAGLAAPVTGGTSYLLKLPATITAGIVTTAAPATGDGVNESAVTVTATTGTGNVVLASNPTLTTPTIADHTNAQHNHGNAAGGGNIPEGSVTSLTSDLAAKAPLASPTFTGTVTAANLTVSGTCTGCGGSATVDANSVANAIFVSGTGSNTITGATTTAYPVAYVQGQTIRLLVGTSNTGAATININSVGAVAVTQNGGTALSGGELVAGRFYLLTYRAASSSFDFNVGAAGSTSVTTKGDLQGYDTAANRVPVGSNGQVLTADSTQAIGVKWAPAGTAAAGGSNLNLQYNSSTVLAGVPNPTATDPQIVTQVAGAAPTTSRVWSTTGPVLNNARMIPLAPVVSAAGTEMLFQTADNPGSVALAPSATYIVPSAGGIRPELTINNAGTGGTGTGLSLIFSGGGCSVQPVGTYDVTAGALSAYRLTSLGSGCTSAPTVAATNGSLSGATITATFNAVDRAFLAMTSTEMGGGNCALKLNISGTLALLTNSGATTAGSPSNFGYVFPAGSQINVNCVNASVTVFVTGEEFDASSGLFSKILVGGSATTQTIYTVLAGAHASPTNPGTFTGAGKFVATNSSGGAVVFSAYAVPAGGTFGTGNQTASGVSIASGATGNLFSASTLGAGGVFQITFGSAGTATNLSVWGTFATDLGSH